MHTSSTTTVFHFLLKTDHYLDSSAFTVAYYVGKCVVCLVEGLWNGTWNGRWNVITWPSEDQLGYHTHLFTISNAWNLQGAPMHAMQGAWTSTPSLALLIHCPSCNMTLWEYLCHMSGIKHVACELISTSSSPFGLTSDVFDVQSISKSTKAMH